MKKNCVIIYVIETSRGLLVWCMEELPVGRGQVENSPPCGVLFAAPQYHDLLANTLYTKEIVYDSKNKWQWKE